MYERWFKRVLDVVLASGALLVLSPLLAVAAACVYLEDRGPVLFRQPRVGRDHKLFTLLKFRSMPVGTADLPSHQAGAIRVTRTGRVLRRTNCDELPQLINIVRGDMSIVGPRPALPAQEELIALREASSAIRCRPGLTGLAQINAYDGMPASEKANWDAEYAKRIALRGDLLIILRTVSYLRKSPPTY